MFGRHAAERRRKEEAENKRNIEAEAARKEITDVSPQEQVDTAQETSRQVQEASEGQVEKQIEKDRGYRKEDRSDIEESLSRDFVGLSDAEKTAMQETANRQISRQSQRADRQMQSQAGQRGFVGGDDALKMETARLATDAQGQFSRDLAVMDADVALQKLTTALIMEESRSADRLLMDAGFRSELMAMMDREKQEKWQDYYAKYGNNTSAPSTDNNPFSGGNPYSNPLKQ